MRITSALHRRSPPTNQQHSQHRHPRPQVLLNQDDADSLFTPPLSTVLSKADADPGDKATASGDLGSPADGQPPPPPEGSPVSWGASGSPPSNIINRGCTANSAPSVHKARILPKRQRPRQQPQDQASPCVSLTPLLGVELTDRAQAAQWQQGVAPPPATMYPPTPPTLHGAPPPPPYNAPYGRDGHSTAQELPSLAAGTSGTAAVALPHPYAPPPSASGRVGPAMQQELPLFAVRPTAAPARGDTPFMALQQQQQQSYPPIDGGAPRAVPGSSAGGLRQPPPPPPPAFLHDDE